MRKAVLTVLATSLIVGSAVQIAAAAERYAHKSERVPQRQRVRSLAICRAAGLVRFQRGSCDLGARRSLIPIPGTGKAPCLGIQACFRESGHGAMVGGA